MTAPRTPFVVGNWKMHGTGQALTEIGAIAAGVAASQTGAAQCAICPPATLIERAVRVARPPLLIGGQDCAIAASGAHTGDVSAVMLRDAGAALVIVGHSERRADHDETDAIVRAKAEAALEAGLIAILCVGESQEDHDRGAALEIVGTQLAGSVPPDADPARLVVAYEPVWAIGSGKTPTLSDVKEMHGFIRRQMARLSRARGAGTRILYGGSVKPANAADLLAVDDVDGALIGGASLKAADFLAIAGVYR